ncbi:MAG: aryl-sulfate sulfotransferase [Chitinophagales bacterium]|nr:aryl-sulfate sulfotransferase [Chitinophagales bacterium]MDW8428195.1 aryl-sulfate sulfotransferase [Chitinophagales bacterium]
MKFHRNLSFLIILASVLGQQAGAQFQYLSPMPGSKYHPVKTGIIIREGEELMPEVTRQHHLFHIVGEQSGVHQFTISLATDGKTLNLKPLRAFAEGETVTVTILPGLTTRSGRVIGGTEFKFQTKPYWTPEERKRVAEHMQQVYREDDINYYAAKGGPESGFPDFTININTAPAAGEVFFSHFSIFGGIGDPHYCIIKSNGDSVYGKWDTVNFNNFELNENGYLTLYNRLDSTFIMLDSNYLPIDTFQMKNGYIADVHEFVIFPNGTHYMLCYDPQIVDMTVYNPSYHPAATVIGCVFQKIDAAGNVLLQWRSWDHIDIMDASNIFFQNPIVDYVHANAIFEDWDGHIWLCSRHLSEVTKIDANTGNIIWRFGGKKNQFTFINDNNKISFQHDAHRLPNGNMLLFDNGVYHNPPLTAVKEYVLDEVNKTATLVWSYSRVIGSSKVFSKAMGNVQRLSNGNTFICWGLTIAQPGAPKFTEVDVNNQVVWELTLNSADAVYRAQRHVWEPCARPSASTITVDKLKPTSARVVWAPATNATSYDLQYRKQGTTNWKTKGTNKPQKRLKDLMPETTYEYRIKSKCANISNSPSAFTDIKTFTTPPMRTYFETPLQKPEVNVYPNPVQDVLQVMLKGLDGPTAITLYSLQGQVLQHQQFSEAQPVMVDVSFLSSGMYLLEIRSADQLFVQRFIKNDY